MCVTCVLLEVTLPLLELVPSRRVFHAPKECTLQCKGLLNVLLVLQGSIPRILALKTVLSVFPGRLLFTEITF